MPFFAILLAILLMNFSTTGVAVGLFIYAGFKFLLNYYGIRRIRKAREAHYKVGGTA